MKIYLGADHNGFAYKKSLTAFLVKSGYDVVDAGDVKQDPADDFPQFAQRAVRQLLSDKTGAARAILVCGSGQGMAMAANRFKGIRAALCWNISEARSSRNDDNSNVLCLSAQNTTLEAAEAIINTWLATPFAGAARFKRRLKELDEIN